jgi:transcriptional regulator with XRE-family HTH domain
LKQPFAPPYDILTDLLIEARKAAKLTQHDLAMRLSVGQSAVSKVERGMQHLDMVELHRWLAAIGAPTLTEIAQAFQKRLAARVAAEERWRQARRARAAAKRSRKSG